MSDFSGQGEWWNGVDITIHASMYLGYHNEIKANVYRNTSSMPELNVTLNNASEWVVYIHSDVDPRRKIGLHPCNWGNVWELAHYPLYIKTVKGPLWPSWDAWASLLYEAKSISFDPPFTTYADTVQAWLPYHLTPDEWIRINDWESQVQSGQHRNREIYAEILANSKILGSGTPYDGELMGDLWQLYEGCDDEGQALERAYCAYLDKVESYKRDAETAVKFRDHMYEIMSLHRHAGARDTATEEYLIRRIERDCRMAEHTVPRR